MRDYGGTIAVAVFVALVIRFFVIEAYRIPSPAMKPTLEPGDTIFVAKWPFGLRLPWSDDTFTRGRMPRRGEVVVFSPAVEPRRDYVKRVIGLPGDTVAVHLGHLSLNGVDLEEAREPSASPCGREQLPDGVSFPVCQEPPLIEDVAPTKVPEGEIFVIGDFRSETSGERPDASRVNRPKSWGLVPIPTLKGVALLIWMSTESRSSGWFPQFRFERMLRRVE